MTPAHCFLLALEAIKWPSEKHQYSEKCMYFQTLLLWSCFWRDFSIDTMPQDLPNSQYILVAVAALNTQGRSWTWTSPIRSISDGEICHFLLCCLQTSWSLHHISISRIYRLLATCWYLSGVCALSSSRDIARYRLNSPIYAAHKSTSVVYGKKHEIYLYLENYSTHKLRTSTSM